MALFEIKNLTFAYNGAYKNALENVSLDVERGDFVLVCGKSGCGKTTLLRLMKRELSPKGNKFGSIVFDGKNVDELDDRTAAAAIGYVTQNPDEQIVTDKVWHELAFGLESLGEKDEIIRRKVAEICGFLGIADVYKKKTCELSGGQKQLVNLASMLVMNPDVVLLDEPTAQLDPVAASEFLTCLKKLNDELGITVVLVEHRLEETFAMANKVVVMDNAKVVISTTPRNIGEAYNKKEIDLDIFEGLPTAVRLFKATGGKGECPLTVKEGKKYVENGFNPDNELEKREECRSDKNVAIEIKDGYFRYERESDDVLNGLDLKVYENEILCIFGANGAGKTTLLRILAGTRRLYKGKYRLWNKKIKEYNGNSMYRGNLAALPQNPQDLFVKSTVYDDLKELTVLLETDKKDRDATVVDVMRKMGIERLAKQHPYDLSGGEQQKVAMAKILLMKPKIILLDEPTKGLDSYSKKQFAKILSDLKAEGKTLVLVTHDVEFAAEFADRCAMFFDGKIVSVEDKITFFANNAYYTTAARRITRNTFADAVTLDRAIELCNKNKKGL